MVNIDMLEAGYAEFFQRLTAWGEAQQFIQAMFVSGSIAKGTADAFSDLDLVVVATEAQISSLVDDAREVIGDVESIVLEYRLNPIKSISILSIVTEKWHRIDLAFGDAKSALLNQLLVPVFDPDNLWDGTFSEQEPLPVSSGEVTGLATEFIRVLGLSAVVNGRGDVHIGHEGANLLRSMFIDLLLMEPPRRMRPGAKKLLPVLNDEQQSALKGLPPVADNLEILNTFNNAIAGLFLPRAKALTVSLGGVWPTELEEATRIFLRDTLKI
jgi:hypothetical protein